VNDPSADTGVQDTQSSSALVLGSGSNLIAAFNDSGSWIPGVNDHFTGFSRSADGGASWTDEGSLPDSTGGDAGDPVLARDASSGTIFLSTLNFDTLDTIQVFSSSDDGVSFSPAVNAAPGLGGLGDLLDKEWIAVDNFAGTGQGHVYLVLRDFTQAGPGSPRDGILFFRSTDGGSTWGPSGGLLIAGSGNFNVQGAFVTVGPDHAVYIFWLDQSAGAGTPNVIEMKKSTDLGVSFGSVVTVATLSSSNTGTNGDLGLQGGFRTNSFPQAAVNPVSGNLYVVYNDAGVDPDAADIYFRQSLDGGATWGSPVSVSDDTSGKDQFHPSLAVTPDGTALFVGFYDRRLDPAGSLIDRFGAIATISGSTVALLPNFRITSGSFPVAIGQDPAVAADFMGDYDIAAADNASFYAAWGDNRNSDSAHSNEPDVFFATIPVAGPGVVLEAAGSSLAAESCLPGNGAMDPGETVTVDLTLRNSGSGPTTDLVATLEATGGVTFPSGPQSYGAIPPSGGSVSRPFTFVADGACAGTLTATLDLQDGGANLGTLALAFPLGASSVTTLANASAITINDDAPATPYPSALTVSGVTGPVTKVTVVVTSFSHTFPSDVDILLAGPTGQTVMLMANVGSSPAANATLAFDDAAASAVTEPVSSGTYKPTRLADSNSPCGADDDSWAAPAPPPPYGSALSGFNGLDPNGIWNLFVRDDCASDAGSIAGGWSLTLFGPIDCCVPVSVSSVTPASGPAEGGTSLVINGASFAPGASVTVAGVPATVVSVVGPTEIDATTGPGTAGTVGDVVVANADGESGSLPNGFVYDFLDVPASHLFHDFIVAILRDGITAGCGAGNYCPDGFVTRAQMAVFLLKGEHGSSYVPPPASGIFGDVPPGSFAADWIEQLSIEGITAGCGGGNYCPDNPVTRAQMAVFLLRAEHGSSFLPPACAGIFQDVECTPAPAFAVDWIERLYAEGVTGGCNSNPRLYCPDNPNTRGQMAVFLVEAFNLPLP